jgi:hypothetical protein
MGWALVPEGGNLLLSGMLPAGDFSFFMAAFALPSSKWAEEVGRWTYERVSDVPEGERIECVVLGNGTGSAKTEEQLARLGIRVLLVDERGTTLAARDLYWRRHSPAPWQRLLPRCLRLPPRILDDMAAWAIALRGVEKLSRQ